MSAEGTAVPGGRFLVVGCGSIGKRHLSNLRHLGVEDIIAVDPREDRQQEVRERFGVQVWPDLARGLKEDVHAALVCSLPVTTSRMP